jgi:leucyl-tRNA synthetase
MEYNHRDIEKKWQKYWAKEKPFRAEDNSSKPKYYILDMFPYPSGAGLHVGHPLGYIASDIVSRYKRHKGFNVLHPMGYDSFGLPAEQYAIQTGQHPDKTTKENIARYREQLDKIGFSFDWEREVRTSDPNYYKWTQWIFIQLFNSWYNPRTNKAENIETLIAVFSTEGFKGNEHDILTGDIEKDLAAFTSAEWKSFNEKKRSDVLMNFRLAYLGEAYVNWCPAMGTVLANDEVKDGVSERGGHPVERKLMKQWSMRITAYAQRLLDGLNDIDWSESLKEAQRNWIGRSQGCSIRFEIAKNEKSEIGNQKSEKRENYIEVFTTRPDTLFGVSYLTLAPEHDLVDKISTAEQKEKVNAYVTYSKNRSERERQADVKNVSGEFTGAYAIHPFTKDKIPVWIGDYVLAGYGTGAVMAVPAHDTRDFSFANHFGLPIKQVVETTAEWNLEKEAYDEKKGKIINSDFLNGLEVIDAVKLCIQKIEENKFGKGQINFRLRDAVFGRQRYWGEPIPVYYKDGIPHAMNENELPLTLPEVDKYLPTADGEPPLARANNWKYHPKDDHPKDGKGYDYEHTTMPGWAGSSWYFLRYMDPHNTGEFVSKNAAEYWKEIDLYMGGAEHATGHLLYFRFWTKFLKDIGKINIEEPAKKLINQGMIGGISQKKRTVKKSKSSGYDLNGQTYLSINNITTNIPEIDAILKGISEDNHFPILFSKYTAIYISEDLTLSDYSNTWESYVPVDFCDGSLLKVEKYISHSNELEEYCNIFISKSGIQILVKVENQIQVKFYNSTNDTFKFLTRPEVEKMSKSKFNVVTPDRNPETGEDGIIEKFGADSLRLYEMFLGPLTEHKPWDTKGIEGVSRFLKKFWRLFYVDGKQVWNDEEPTKAEYKVLHKTIKRVTEDIERYSFNTVVSTFMIGVNELTDLKCNKKKILESFVVLLSPYAPHIAEELWNLLGNSGSITTAQWPKLDESYLVEDSFAYPISFNGKTRFNIEMSLTLGPPEIEKIVMAHDDTHKYLEGKTPKKVIIVPKKIVNIVV